MLVSLALPPFLVHRMSTAEYGAWVLILQLGSYVNFLDLGLSTAIGKFIAEYDTTGQHEQSRRLVSTAFTILCAVSLLALFGLGILVLKVPQIFRGMPPPLLHPVRLALIWVGISTCLGLPVSVFAGVFNGLQRYGFPTVLYTVSRVSSSIALVVVLLAHGTLLQMAITLAAFNLATSAFQVYGWWHLMRDRVRFSLFLFDRQTARQLADYCGVLSLWTLSGICISGLDTAIVARYDFPNTAFYAAAGSATNFMLVIVGNLMSPLLPALSSLQLRRSPAQMGELIVKTTRYGALLLWAVSVPLIFGAYPLLTAWVGSGYATHAALYLRILVIANVLRQLGGPYSLAVIAMGKQRLATLSPIAEALVNLVASILLARHMGAIGVALGTLLGAFVGLTLHLVVSMSLTWSSAQVRRPVFLWRGVARPALCVLPFLLLLPYWRSMALLPWPPLLLAISALASLALAWWVAVDASERTRARAALQRFL